MLDLEGLLDEEQADLVTLRISRKLLAQLRDNGLQGDDLPRQADLVPMPRQIYRHMLAHLVRLAQGWVFEHQPLPPALLNLLERRPIPELEPLNRRIRQAPGTEAAELTAFLLQADGATMTLSF